MDTDTFVQQTYLLAAGKATMPAVGTTKYVKILSLGNMFQRQWANEPGIDWNSLHASFEVGTVSATDTYALTDDIAKISAQEGDYVVITRTDGKKSKWTIVPIAKLYTTRRNYADGLVAKSGANLIFDTVFTDSHPDFGGTITLSGYTLPDNLVNSGDPVAVDDPQWLCFMAAGEYVRNDVTKQNQYGNLVALANNSMDGMKERNRSQREEVDTNEWAPLGQTW